MLYFSSRLPSVRSVALFASDFGFSFFGVRSSRSAAGGFVAVCGFSSQYAAEDFAAAVSDLLPPSRPVRNVAVRPPVDAGPAAGMWRISVPVAPASVPFYVLSGFSVSMSGSIPAILNAIRYSRRFKPSSPGMSPVVAQAFIDWMTFFESAPEVPAVSSSPVRGGAFVGLLSPALRWSFAIP